MSEQYLFFYGKAHPLSQHHPCKFIVGETTYSSTEQFMMAQKALLFNDAETFHKIMNTKDPIRQKRLGRQVANFNDEVWNQYKLRIVYDGNKAKFTQNTELKEYILETGDTHLIEASPRDRYWGIGFSAEKAVERKKDWGENMLGKILMKLRDDIRID
jgi:ribA/ribD-fused uncharacterized protein